MCGLVTDVAASETREARLIWRYHAYSTNDMTRDEVNINLYTVKLSVFDKIYRYIGVRATLLGRVTISLTKACQPSDIRRDWCGGNQLESLTRELSM